MIRTVDPTPESFRALKRDVPPSIPVVMVNLLRYRDQAAYPAGSEHTPCTGREAYARYSKHALAAIQEAGGRVVFRGVPLSFPIGPPDERWDEALVVNYPSIEVFFSTIMAPDYQAQAVHRSAALEDARLMCVEARNP